MFVGIDVAKAEVVVAARPAGGRTTSALSGRRRLGSRATWRDAAFAIGRAEHSGHRPGRRVVSEV